MTKRKNDPAETPEVHARPRVTYQTSTGGSVTVEPPNTDTDIAATEAAVTEETEHAG